MTRPAVLQFLRKGKMLVGSVFPNFVDTWNWLVASVDNLRGDKDVDPVNGHVRIDRTLTDRPIIRCDGCGTSTLSDSYRFGRFALDDENNFINCYFRIGGKTIEVEEEAAIEGDGIYCLRVIAGYDVSENDGIEVFDSIDTLRTKEADTKYFYVPIYTVEEGKVTLDWRIGPETSLWER